VLAVLALQVLVALRVQTTEQQADQLVLLHPAHQFRAVLVAAVPETEYEAIRVVPHRSVLVEEAAERATLQARPRHTETPDQAARPATSQAALAEQRREH